MEPPIANAWMQLLVILNWTSIVAIMDAVRPQLEQHRRRSRALLVLHDQGEDLGAPEAMRHAARHQISRPQRHERSLWLLRED